ncbi:MAG TPA: hypothetical protein VGC69_03650 [Bordetella sp.]
MNHPGIRQGELAYWLGVIAEPGGEAEPVPAHIAEALQILRCIEPQGSGFRITNKGQLALRMADPAALWT